MKLDVAKPTPAQADAGNYRKAKLRIHGLDVAIETPRGRARRRGWPRMAAHYGYIKRTTGADGDHVDVFVGPHPESQLVVIVDQVDEGGQFDEHKALLGFTTEQAAVAAYRKCYTPGWKVGPVTTMTIKQFKAWLQDGTQKHPVFQQVSRYSAIVQEAIVEYYAARHPKNSPGQMGLFGDGLGGDTLRSPKRQSRLDWDESKHPRDSDGKFTEKESRSAKSPEQKLLGSRGADVKVLGGMLYDQLDNKKPVSLLGKTVKNSADLGAVAQVYRDPRFETLRAFFVKDGKIIGQNAYSSRMAGVVVFPPEMVDRMAEDLKSLEADGFYMLHNHPSGNPDPSPEDIHFTKKLKETFGGQMLGHTIIDHDKGSTIDGDGKVDYYEQKNEDLQDRSKATVPHELLENYINSPAELGRVAMGVGPAKDRAVVVFTSVKGKVQLLLDVSKESLKKDDSQLLGAVRRISDDEFLAAFPRASGGRDVQRAQRLARSRHLYRHRRNRWRFGSKPWSVRRSGSAGR